MLTYWALPCSSLQTHIKVILIMSNSTTMVSSLSPNAPAFQPRSWRQGSSIQRTPAPQEAAAQTQEPPKPPYLWSAISPHTRLVYITDPRVADHEISRLRPGPLGFDLEWKPTFRKNQPQNLVALVQLANEDTILLLHISRMPGKIHSASLSALADGELR